MPSAPNHGGVKNMNKILDRYIYIYYGKCVLSWRIFFTLSTLVHPVHLLDLSTLPIPLIPLTMSTFAVQLGMEYNPPTPFREGAPFVQGIMSLYELGLEIRVTLKDGENFASVDVEVAGPVYTLMVKKEDAGYFVTAACGAHCKRSFFPLQGRGRHWDTSQ